MSKSLFSLCPWQDPHGRHEWIDGVFRRDCPGVEALAFARIDAVLSIAPPNPVRVEEAKEATDVSSYQFTAEDLRAAFMAGFGVSGEGWNGEYPFDENAEQIDDALDGAFQEWLTGAVA